MGHNGILIVRLEVQSTDSLDRLVERNGTFDLGLDSRLDLRFGHLGSLN